LKKSNNYFHEIVGQQKVVETLTQALNNNHISHSYIFSGPKGTQRTRMAYSFAKALLSEGKPSYSDSSRRVEDHNHPDLINIFPDGTSIKIKQIRDDLIKDISIKPFESKYKIYIVHDAHTMGTPAQNALLKTLEEPPEYGIIILITNNLPVLLPTIISRSQNLQFKPLNENIIQNYLQKRHKIEEQKAREISIMANGSIEKAVSLCQKDNILQEREELLQSLLKIIKDKDVITAFSTAQYLKEHKEHLEELLDFIMLWFRDISLYKELGKNRWIIHREYEDLLQEFSYYLSDDQINVIIEEVNISKNNMKYNVNLQLNMETMLLKMQEE
jgi:DNA polymerase-3 subunit delta'